MTKWYVIYKNDSGFCLRWDLSTAFYLLYLALFICPSLFLFFSISHHITCSNELSCHACHEDTQMTCRKAHTGGMKACQPLCESPWKPILWDLQTATWVTLDINLTQQSPERTAAILELYLHHNQTRDGGSLPTDTLRWSASVVLSYEICNSLLLSNGQLI